MKRRSMGKNHYVYHHRTQGEGVEGVHIRGMVDGFRKCGWTADIVGPPGVDPYAINRQGDKKEEGNLGLLKNFWSDIGEKAPQILFEILEVIYNLYAVPKLIRKSKHGDYAFIYERYALNTFAGALVSHWVALPLILEVNDATVIERSRPLILKRLARSIERRVFARAELVITITEHFKSLITSHYDFPEGKVLVLPNAIDPDRFDLVQEKRLSRKSLGIGDGQIVLGCLGAFVPWHGLNFLISSAADLAREHDLFFLFIGDGPVRQSVEEKARELGVDQRVRFTGFLSSEEVPYHLDLVDICVIPGSNPHCSPMKLFEYMAMGKPIVLPTYKPLFEVVEEGSEGLFFAPGDDESFRKALLKLILDSECREAMGRRALAKVRAFYTWEKNARQALEAVSEGFMADFVVKKLGTVCAGKEK